MKKSSNHDLILISILAEASAFGLALGLHAAILQVPLALLLVFILPGYALSAALVLNPSFGGAERLLVTLGGSILIAILSGLLLNLIPQGLTPATWAAATGGATLVACLVAVFRRRKVVYSSAQPFRLALGWGGSLLLGLALLVTVGAWGLARTPITNPSALQGYAILWILPAGNDAPNTVNLGVMNDQFATTDYDLRIVINHQVVHEWPDIKLEPGEKWETGYELTGTRSGSTPVEAYLYQLSDPATIYRQVKLWVGP